MLTQTQLKALLDYDQNTGIFTNRVSRRGHAKAGQQAGSKMPAGYITIQVARHKEYAHRLAFLWMTGSLPSEDVDHINGDLSDIKEVLKQNTGLIGKTREDLASLKTEIRILSLVLLGALGALIAVVINHVVVP